MNADAMLTQKMCGTTAVLMLTHVAGMIDLVALPLWIGALVQHYGLDFERAGMTVTLFLAGVVAASLWFAPRFDRLPRRGCAIAGYAIGAAGFLLAPQTSTWPALLALHAAAGLGIGCGLSMAHGTMGRNLNPHRLFALSGTALGLFAMVFYALVPALMARTNPTSLFLVIGGLMACASFASLAFPAGEAAPAVARHARVPIPPLLWLLVAGVACLAINQSIMFSFLERIGVERGFGLDGVNAVLAAVGIANLFAAPLAGMLQKHLRPVTVAMIATVVQIGLAFTISSSSVYAPYAAAGSIYAFVIIFAHPFLFGLAARLDPSGRTNALTPAMLMIGAALAPALAGMVAQRFGFGGLGVLVAVFGATGFVCFGILGKHLEQTADLPPAPVSKALAAD